MKNNESVKREICAFILDLAVFERKLRKAFEDAEHGLNNSFKNKLDLETLQNLNLEISPICFDFMKKLGVFVSGIQSLLPGPLMHIQNWKIK